MDEERSINSATVLEEYKLLVSLLEHIFTEFWQTNAFFVSFLTFVAGGFIGGRTQLLLWPRGILIGSWVAVLTAAAVWWATNLRHDQYTRLHMDHARSLEPLLGFEIYRRRLALEPSVLSARRIWRVVPLGFAVIISLILFDLVTAR